MSGHSKWHSIKHKKAAADSKKGAVFTRLARNITLAAKEGGGDPETNFRLRMAIDQAKNFNMPKDNMERAIAKGTGEDGADNLQEVIYEAYGPGGSAFILQVVTDNINRTVSDLRHTLSKNGGSLAENGSVMWNFEQKGILRISKNNNKEEVELQAIEAGAEDIKEDDDETVIITDIKDLHIVKEKLESAGLKIEQAGLEYIAKNKATLEEADEKKFEKFVEAVDDLEDVNDYFTNVE